MVILRQERVFSYAGRGKFAECWMIIVYDTSGPSILLFKDESAKKAIFDKLHIPSLAAHIRFGTTCRPYGSLPEIKPDPKIDSSCLMAFQVERRVKKTVQTQILWLCAESTKQMFGIMKILACGLTIMNFPAPAKNTDPNDINALHHYRPKILQPTNGWEQFWDNPPAARLISPMELAQNVTKSMDALNVAVQQQQQQVPQQVDTVVKSRSTPELETLARRHSTVSCRSSTTSSASSTSRSISGRRRSSKSIRVWELNRIQDMPRIPYSPQKVRKYERQESAHSSPTIFRQIERQQKRTVAPEPPCEEEEPIYIKRNTDTMTQPHEIYQPYEVQQTVKAVPPTAPPLPPQMSPVQKLPPKPVYQEIHHYDKPPEESETEEDENCRVCHPPPTHHHHSHRPHHRRYHSVDRPSPPQPILKRQMTKPYEVESPPQTKRPVSGYSSSAYGSGHVTPTHLAEQPQKKEFEVELLRRMSDLSLRPFSRTLTSPPITHYEKPGTPPVKQHYYEKPTTPPIKQNYYEKPATPPVKERHHHHKKHRHYDEPPKEPHYHTVYQPPPNEVSHPSNHVFCYCSGPEIKHSHPPHEVCHSPPHEVCHSPPHEVCHSPPHEVCHSPPHEVCHSPQHKEPLVKYKPVEEPKQMTLLEQSAIPLKSERRISDPEYMVKPRHVKRHTKRHKLYISQGVQTDHEPSDVPLIENFEVPQTKRFSFESHEPHLHHYHKLSQSTHSIYVQHLNEGNEYETVRPFFRTSDCSSSSECGHDEYEYSRKSTQKRHSHPILINDSLGTRTYTVDVDSATGGLL